MKRRRTPEGERINAKQYALAFRDHPESLARTEAFLRRMIELTEDQARVYASNAASTSADPHASTGSKWSATYHARKAARRVAEYRAALEGHLEGAATPLKGAER